MKILALDTSGPVCGVAMANGDRIVYEASAVNKFTHSASLMPMVEEGLTRCGWDVGDVELFAVVVGPGSFTGVRIGVSTVKGMAHGANRPCVAIDALEALASGVNRTDALICPIQDARAGQVYGAAFRAGMPPERRMADEAAKLDEYLEHALTVANDGDVLCFVGDGVATYRRAIEEHLGERAVFPPAHLSYLRAASVALLAQAHADEQVDYLALQPKYLRAPQAERARAARLKAEAKA